jgi:hypothetical protein
MIQMECATRMALNARQAVHRVIHEQPSQESCMIEKLADPIPIWMVLSAAFGFLLGELAGDYNRRRKCLQREDSELRDRLNAAPDGRAIQRALKESPRKTPLVKTP